ncbi:MAG: aldehyde dehydrogenase family protein, partial [Actinomycetota bacterium]|nr:aldehyde dehydrogenase family protein [Actinomycetota bacterium]
MSATDSGSKIAPRTLSVASIVGGEVLGDSPGGGTTSSNPALMNESVGEVKLGDAGTFVDACQAAREAQRDWAAVPAPIRAGVIKKIGRLVESNKEALARLVTREIGKPYTESL